MLANSTVKKDCTSMFSVKDMSADDIPFAVRLTNTMNWNMAEGDFEFMMELEPKGCFVLLYNSERVGIVTTISFGKIGWFGNLIISEEHRKKGAGSLLATHALKYLKDNNVKTVGLYSYIETVPFYERLGFACNSYFIILKGKGFSSLTDSHIRAGAKADIQKIIDYDSSCLGFSRRKLLEPLLLYPDNLFYIYAENGEVLGYAIAKIYRGVAELGPLVCHHQRSEIAVNLLKATLNKLDGLEVSMCISEKQTALLNILKHHGFGEKFRVARMFHGPPLDNDCICIAESLERG
jgi:GNAT superfamily N-acetyltransferase